MTIYIALLRGINVGGKNRLPMAELREALAGIGLQDVQTYIQSGNVVFKANSDTDTLSAQIRDAVAASHGFAPRVMVLAAQALLRAAAGSPYP